MYNSLNEFHIIKLLQVQGIPSRAPKIISVSWKPPPPGWFKVNTDGSSLGAPEILELLVYSVLLLVFLEALLLFLLA